MPKLTHIKPELEKRWDEFTKMGQALKIPTPAAFWGVESFGPDGAKVQEVGQRCESYVRNAYNVFFSMMCGIASLTSSNGQNITPKVLTGTNKDSLSTTMCHHIYNYGSYTNALLGGAGIADKGIVCGTAATAENFESYDLGARVLNGNAAGQMTYSAQETPVPVYDGASKKWTVTLVRYINNNSGGTIIINEIGLIWTIESSSSLAENVLMARDLLASPISVLNGGQLKITYTLEFTFPE